MVPPYSNDDYYCKRKTWTTCSYITNGLNKGALGRYNKSLGIDWLVITMLYCVLSDY